MMSSKRAIEPAVAPALHVHGMVEAINNAVHFIHSHSSGGKKR